MPNLGEACSVHTTATAATSAKTFVDATGSNSNSNNNNNNNNNNKHNNHNNNNNKKSSNNSKSNTNNKSNGNSSNNSKSNTNNNSNNIKSNNSNNKTAATTTTARATPTTKAMATLRASTTTSTTKATTTKVTCYIYHFSRSIAFVVETVWDYVGKFIVQAHFYSQPAQSKTLVNDCASGKHGQNRLSKEKHNRTEKTWHKYAQVDNRLHPIRSFVSAWKKVTGALGKKQPRTFILFKQITFDAKKQRAISDEIRL